MRNPVEGVLGLAQKAGKIASGDMAVKEALAGKGGKHTYVLLLADDAGTHSEKELVFQAEKAKVPIIRCLSRNELGRAIGKPPRAALAVLDAGFAKLIQSKL